MGQAEVLPLPVTNLVCEREAEVLRVAGRTYEARFRTNGPYLDFYDAQEQKWASFFIPGSVDTLEEADETCSCGPMVVDQDAETVTVRVPMESSGWQQKTAVWKFREDVVETYFELEGEGHITTCSYFGGNLADGKDSGYFPSEASFSRVFSPEPDERGEAVHSAAEPAGINVTGMGLTGRKDWIFTPPPYCFSFAKEQPDQWLNAGVATPIEDQNFTEVRYESRQSAFALLINYEGHTKGEGTFKTPSVLLHFSADPYAGIADYRHFAQQLGYLQTPKKTEQPDWHTLPGWCGWGAAVERADHDLHKTAQDLATQQNYETDDKTLQSHGIIPAVKTIDDKWQTHYGTNKVDTEKWPDMPGYIRRSHEVGQHVLLWLKAWDPEGLPPELCVRNQRGVPVGVDPSNPAYLAVLEEQIERMVSPDGYDADGFKIDFTARTPSGQSLEAHGPEWGAALLHRMLKTIYDTAKRVKPNAMIVTHTPNPWFEDVTDVIRLNDIFTAVPLVPQMRYRAMVAKAACPGLLVDTDNWPMRNKTEWRRYLRSQSQLGVPWLYFVDRIAGEPMTESDYAAVRRTWGKYAAQTDRVTSEKNRRSVSSASK
jgi:hypothetical protein